MSSLDAPEFSGYQNSYVKSVEYCQPSASEEVLVVDLAVGRHIHYIHIVTQIYIWLWKSRGSNGSGVVAYIIWSNNMCGR